MTTKKSRKKRELILEAALKRLMKYGYAKTTISEIAADVGLTKTGIYHYYASKEALVLVIADTMFERYMKGMRTICDSDRPVAQKLIDLIDLRENMVTGIFEEYETLFEDMLLVLPIIRERKEHYDATVVAMLKQMLTKAHKTGEIVVDDPNAFANLFMLLMSATDLNHYNRDEEKVLRCPQQDIISEFKNLILRGTTRHDA